MPAVLEKFPKKASATAGASVILSIYPMDMVSQSYHAGMFKYFHPAAKQDKMMTLECNPDRTTAYPAKDSQPFIFTEDECEFGNGYTQIIVHDSYQLTRDWVQDQETYVKRDIYADAIAKDLVREWGSGRLTDSAAGGPGIIVYNPRVSLEEHLAIIRDQQTMYFRELIFQGDKFAEAKQWDMITNLHRVAAGWLQEETRPWYNPIKGNRTKLCAACGENMNLMALVCKSCGTNIITFAKDMLAHGVEINDPVLEFYKIEQSLPQVTKQAKEGK